MLHRSIPLNLALQGGGSHGAFTWGVLDALLEEGRCAVAAVSGASAGAMNAVVLAHGLLDGPDAARAALRAFWEGVAASVPAETAVHDAEDRVRLSPLMRMAMHWSHVIAPVQLNPLNVNPLRDVLAAQVDFERLRRTPGPPVLVSATHANSGRLRLFQRHELTVDALLASACLPTLFQPVVVDGEPYWDGGYAANPAVEPLLQASEADDTLLVLLSPASFDEVPVTAKAIQARSHEIAFNAAFRREMQLLARWQQLHAPHAPAGWLSRQLAGLRRGSVEQRLSRARFHVVEAHEDLARHAGDSKLAVGRAYFEALHRLGRERAAAWLEAHHRALGRRSSIDLAATFA